MARFIVRDLEDDVKVRLTPRAVRLAGRIGLGAYPPYNAARGTGGMSTVAGQI